MVAACSPSGQSTSPPVADSQQKSTVVTSLSARQYSAQSAAYAATLAAKFKDGYTAQYTGSAYSADPQPNGSIRINMGKGNHLVVDIVPKTAHRLHLQLQHMRARTSWYGEDCTDGTCDSATPRPVSDGAPPNYPDCSSSGGATWYNNLTTSYGCVRGGGQEQLSCGLYKLDSPGHGKLIFNNGDVISNINWVRDHGESGCDLA
jgi:hypothetical protein